MWKAVRVCLFVSLVIAVGMMMPLLGFAHGGSHGGGFHASGGVGFHSGGGGVIHSGRGGVIHSGRGGVVILGGGFHGGRGYYPINHWRGTLTWGHRWYRGRYVELWWIPSDYDGCCWYKDPDLGWQLDVCY